MTATCGLALALGLGAAEHVAVASPPVVELLASRGSRLADDLRRELGTSGFLVVVVESTTGDWRGDVLRLVGHPPIHGVVVRADERLMTVFTRTASPNAIEAHLEQTVEPHDRLARRRACLGVVEYLRVLSENDPPAPFELGTTSNARAGAPRAPTVPATTAVTSSPESPSLPKSLSGSLSPNPPTVAPPSPSSSARPSLAAAAAAPSTTTSPAFSPRRDGAGAGAGLAQTGSTPEPQPAVPTDDTVAVAGRPLSGAVSTVAGLPPRDRGWEVGAGSTLDLEASPGGPTVHLQFLWYLPLEWRLAICVRALWPVLGGQFRTGGNDIRVWTFGSAASLQYLLKTGAARLRPFVGTALGTRVALSETTAVDALQSRETFTPSATLGAEMGVRYALSPLIHLFLEAGVVRGWLIPGVHRAPHEEQAANSNSLHASFGVLFEI